MIPTPGPPTLRRFCYSDHVLLTLMDVYVLDRHLLLAVKSGLFCRCLQVDQAGMNSSNSAGPTSKLRSSYLLPESHSKPGF